MLIDSHCHLDFPEFAEELDQVVARARAAGVRAMVSIATRPDKFAAVMAIAERYDDVYCAIGVHPHEAGPCAGYGAAELIAAARHPKVVAIGETGLDYHYDRSPRDQQAWSFREHIRAARETGLPLIVHTREADADTIEILSGEMPEGAYTGLIHCFSSGLELAVKSVEIGLYISMSGIVTFKTAEAIRDAVRQVPLDRLLVETDAPFLAPIPYRGKRNEPAYVAHTAARAAEFLGQDPAAFADRTTDNFLRLFTRVPRPV